MSEPSSWDEERQQVEALGYRQARYNFMLRFPDAEALRRFDERFDPLGLQRLMNLGAAEKASGGGAWSPGAIKFAQDAEARYLAERAADPSRNSAPLLTPYELGVLLHYYHRAGEGAWLEMEPANAARRKLADSGFLHVPQPVGGWDLTARGRAYIDSLLRVPWPEAVWVTRWPQP